ncbi:interleukin-10 receptor subunit beta-like isoform X2 [Salminus brasiliensis]|uniref:interleukin-10 receptor subunit beta-like isoform X2 n=1 Tax=Salminus brasiliensis TaxID=930266 RepID=UPI003B838A0A
MFVTLITLLFYNSLNAAEGQVPSPESVTIISLDMGLVLTWDPPQNSTGKNFTYTAEYKGYRSFQAVCLNDWSLSCDFTANVTAFGTYDLRVRTELEGRSSDWVVIENISLDNITIISAPEVKLQSRKGEIEVDITDPVLRKSNLREYFHPISYRIRYWTEGEEKKEELKAEQSRIMLQTLIPKVRYCVQVEILTNKYTESSSGEIRTSLPSNKTCILNTENDVEPWLIVVVLLGSCVVVLVLVVLVFFACWYTYRGFRFLHPKAKLPEHFKQYLCEHPKSSLFLAMQNNPQPEEHYHEVSIIQCLEDPIVPQELQKAEGPKCTKPYATISSKPEEGQSQEVCGHEQNKDGEMEQLLQ